MLPVINEADMLNVVLFGKTAKQWKNEVVNARGNLDIKYMASNLADAETPEFIFLHKTENNSMPLVTKHSNYLEKMIYEIYPPNDDYELWGVEIKPGAMPDTEDVSQEILFENIGNQIIEEIHAANYNKEHISIDKNHSTALLLQMNL